MKTETQIYEDHIAAQLSRLEALEQEQARIKIDIDNVRKLMVECPYEVPRNN